jgi:DivIVA domain-containing protein
VTLVLLLVALVVAGVVAAVAVGRVPGGLEEPTTSRPSRALPDGPLAAEDLDRVRFSLGLRGYRMDEVDAVLDRLREEIRERDEELAAWRSAED